MNDAVLAHTRRKAFLSISSLPAPFRVAFTARDGGLSKPPYDSLNMALHAGDAEYAVRANRASVCGALNVPLEKLVVARQTHSPNAVIVGMEASGRGSVSHTDAIPDADALVTGSPGLPLMALSADCLLVALGDPEARILGLAHAGWRGMAGGVLENTVSKMTAAGAQADRIHAVGGPCIGPCCFEVGLEVVAALGPECCVRTAGQKAWVDLRRAARARLMRSGLRPEKTGLAQECTCCQRERLFSHRRSTLEGARACGRMAMLAWIE